jgi:hypothetical protein
MDHIVIISSFFEETFFSFSGKIVRLSLLRVIILPLVSFLQFFCKSRKP